MASIRTRLTLSYLAVIVIAMSLSGFLLLSFLQQYFLQAAEDSLVAQAQITAQALVPGALAAGPPVEPVSPAYNAIQQQQLGNLALQAQNVAPPSGGLPLDSAGLAHLADASFQLSTQLDTRIRILNLQGQVLVDSDPARQGANLQADPLVTQALSGQYASRTDPEAISVALPVLVGGRSIGVVYLSQPLHDVAVVLNDLRQRWLLSTLIALLLSGATGLLLSGAIARPLARLTEAAGAVARGRLDQRVPVTSKDELGRLSQTFNDMTTRLQAARQMQLDIVANVSHELRTPLTGLKGLVETLREGAVDDREARDSFLEMMENDTDRLIRLVNDLLFLSRLDAEALVLNRETVDLAELAEAAADRLRPLAAAAGLSLVVEAPSPAPTVWADPDRLEQVLLNLLDNAIKYSRPGGRVTVTASGQPPQLRVADQGIGIPAADLARVGQRFYRADKARSRAHGGSGLGLAIASALVEAHGGQLQLESEEGQGTTVTVTLLQTA